VKTWLCGTSDYWWVVLVTLVCVVLFVSHFKVRDTDTDTSRKRVSIDALAHATTLLDLSTAGYKKQ
jgi:hypothetical protein